MEVDDLITLIKTVSESSVTKFQYEQNGTKICIKKETNEKRVSAVSSEQDVFVCTKTSSSNVPAEEEKYILSPLVGRFYAAPAQDAAPFVSAGDSVKKGQIVAIVEAMKLMNDIESDFDGVVAEILVENGAPVEYGQPLFRIIS